MELLRVLQEVHDLMEFLLGLIHPGHIGEGYGGPRAGEDAGPAPAKVHGLGVGPLGPLEDEEEDQAYEDKREVGE